MLKNSVTTKNGDVSASTPQVRPRENDGHHFLLVRAESLIWTRDDEYPQHFYIGIPRVSNIRRLGPGASKAVLQ